MKKTFLWLTVAAGLALTPAQAQTNAPVKAAAANPTEIFSDGADFDLNGRRAEYFGHVIVTSANLKLECERLTVDLPADGEQHVNHVAAETNVVIHFEDSSGTKYAATSAKAVYTYEVVNHATNELVVLTGSPKVTTDKAVITGDPLVWDRTNGKFHGTNSHITSQQGLGGLSATNTLIPGGLPKTP